MSSIIAWLKAPHWGAPAWVWILAFGVLPLLNELLQRAKWTRAQSILQGIARVLLVPFGKVPVLGDVFRALAGPAAAPPEEGGPPPPAGPPPAVLVLLVASLGLLGACKASPIDIATAFRTASSNALSTTVIAFGRFDDQRQKEIVEKAESYPLGRAALAQWRTEVQGPFHNGSKSAADAIGALTAAIEAAKAGFAQDWGTLTANVLRALGDIAAIIARHKLPVPPPSVSTDPKDQPEKPPASAPSSLFLPGPAAGSYAGVR